MDIMVMKAMNKKIFVILVLGVFLIEGGFATPSIKISSSENSPTITAIKKIYELTN